MASTLDTSSALSGSLTARRPAATNLGCMNLPPLPFRQTTPAKPVAFMDPSRQTSVVNSGNLLTPPTTLSGDTLSPISGLMGDSNNNSSAAAWLRAQSQQMEMGNGITPSSWSLHNKSLFSPTSTGATSRQNTHSPNASNGGVPPPQIGQPQTSTDPIQASPFSNVNASAIAAANAHAFGLNSLNHALPGPLQQHTQEISDEPTTSTSPLVNSGLSSPPSAYPYSSMSQPASANTAQFNFNTAPTPTPLSAPLTGGSKFPASAFGQHPQYMPQSAQFNLNRAYSGSFQVPMAGQHAMVQGPVMSNLHNPHSQQMAMLGMNGLPPTPYYHSGHAAMHGQQHPIQQDRPFRCDVCPQAFNRNHDLKRHKRIHLAVKPFPCEFCDKSFSRKDALKRHGLVKGCGKPDKDGNIINTRTQKPDAATPESEVSSPQSGHA